MTYDHRKEQAQEAKQRAAFEVFYAGSRRNRGRERAEHLLDRLPDDTYALESTQRHWWTWQNAHAVALSAVAPVQVEPWQPIETAPKSQLDGMFVVRGFRVSTGLSAGHTYTTDPYCVWRDDGDGSFARWPHQFAPTHWMPLPPAPQASPQGGADQPAQPVGASGSGATATS
jgi:hypothetical protein